MCWMHDLCQKKDSLALNMYNAVKVSAASFIQCDGRGKNLLLHMIAFCQHPL